MRNHRGRPAIGGRRGVADEHAPADLKSGAQGLFGAAFFGIGSAFWGLVLGLIAHHLLREHGKAAA